MEFFFQFGVLLLAIILTLILFFLLCVASVFQLFRYTLNLTCSFWNSKLRRIVPIGYYHDRNGEALVGHNLLISFRIEGLLDIKEFTSEFCKKCVLASRSPGVLAYPEFQEKVTMFMGYPFWTEDEQFSISNHIVHVKSLNMTNEEDISTFEQSVLNEPFQIKKMSPWKVYITEDFEHGLSGIFFTFHHSLGDGISMYNVLMRLANTQVPLQPASVPKSFWKQWLRFIANPLMTQLLGDLRLCKWKPPFKKSKSKRLYSKSNGIHKSTVKQIANKLQVPFTTVLLYTITSAMRKFLLSLNQIPSGALFCNMAIRSPNHKPTLSNEMLMIYLKLPIDIEGSKERFTECQKTLEMAPFTKYSVFVKLYDFLFNAFPIAWTPANPAVTSVFSSFPGPSTSVTLGPRKHLVTDLYFYSQYHDSSVIFISTLTYADKLTIVLAADTSTFPHEKDVNIFMEIVEDELNELHQQIKNNYNDV